MAKDRMRQDTMTVGVLVRATRKEEFELAKQIEEGDKEARNDLAMSCYPMLLMYCSKLNLKGMVYEDAVNEGVMGLMRAADKYDPNQTRFSTYAMLWIRQSVLRYLETISMISIPSYIRQMIRSGKEDLNAAHREYKAAGEKVMSSGMSSLEDGYDRSSETDIEVRERLQLESDKEEFRVYIEELPEEKQELIKMRLRGTTLEHMGHHYSCTRQNIDLRIQKVMRDYKRWLDGNA